MLYPAGNPSETGVLDVILSEIRKINSSQAVLQLEVQSLKRAFLHHLSSPDIEHVSGDAPDSVLQPGPPGLQWICPVCEETYKHKESFKGHIRKLLYATGRSRCHLNPHNVDHRILVHRFPGENVQQQIAAFVREFYSQVCFSCTKRDADDLSHAHVFAWISAAKSNETQNSVIPFPVFDPACSSASRKHRRVSCESSTSSSLQSSQSSSFLSSSYTSFSP